jgi:hypothetical protein
VRENLGGVQTFANPYGTSQPVELPTTHTYYWTDRQGRMVGTNDPSADPNVGSTGEPSTSARDHATIKRLSASSPTSRTRPGP